VIDELCELLRRETDAASTLERRLRALELVVAADEQRLVSLALDEMKVAAEHLAALELTRVLALSTAGHPIDVSASDLIAGVTDPASGARMRKRVADLTGATERLAAARHRAEVVVANELRTSRERLHAADASASH
jgi:hypothetical protein